MRAISPPTAHPIAAAALALVAAVLAPLAAPSAALAERWLRPVPGEVARPFSYSRTAPFARGAHRGADLAAPPGAVVRSACEGRVVHAGAVAGPEQVLSMRCGGRRVSYLPLAAVAVREGARIRAGAPLGTIAAGHGGLHLGVRREGDAFGYEDPLPLLAPTAPPSAPATRPTRRPSGPRPTPLLAPRPRAAPVFSPRLRAAPVFSPRLRAAPVFSPRQRAAPVFSPRQRAAPHLAPRRLADPAPSPLVPWPVWAGLAALLAGAAGSGTIAVRRRVARSRATAASSVPVG